MDGEEAVEFFHTRHEEIDIVLLDLVMPRMDGEECLRHLRAIDPEVAAVIMTGYFVDDATRGRLQSQTKGFLTKPFGIAEVLNVVAKALPGGPRGIAD